VTIVSNQGEVLMYIGMVDNDLKIFLAVIVCVFFFSSRRRHTRWPRDWSSDVCSSDLFSPQPVDALDGWIDNHTILATDMLNAYRSEERRVGKECRSRLSPYH